MISYKEFRSVVKKPTPQMGFDYLYRLFSYPISYILNQLHFTANGVSIVSIIITILSGIILVTYSPIVGLSGLIVAYILDFCDGNIARFSEHIRPNSRTSRSRIVGIILENLNTNISTITFVSALGLYISYSTGSMYSVLISILYISVFFLYRYTYMHYQSLVKVHSELNNAILFKNSFYFKSFLSKALFNVSTYYLFFLLVLLFWEKNTQVLFISYITLATIYFLLRFIGLFFRMRYI